MNKFSALFFAICLLQCLNVILKPETGMQVASIVVTSMSLFLALIALDAKP